MSINVTDPARLPIRILSIKLNQVSLVADETFLDKIVKQKVVGIKRDNYYLLNTGLNMGGPNTKELQGWNLFLRLCQNKGYKLLMINIK